jgi:hypothetical protein
MADREREVVTALVEPARVTLRLDHRLNHIRMRPTWVSQLPPSRSSVGLLS